MCQLDVSAQVSNMLLEKKDQQRNSVMIYNVEQNRGRLLEQINNTVTKFTLSLPRVINFKFPLQPHHKYYTAQYEEIGFSYLTEMKDDTISHYLTYDFH